MFRRNRDKSLSVDYKKPKDWSWLPGLIAVSVALLAAFLFLSYRQALIDRIVYMNYQPSEAIEKISSDATLTEDGKFYFYISKPEIEDAKTFNTKCVKQEATSVILGCYSQQQIYIYDVKNNDTLSGVKTVTAAHEMLHAAWERLPSSEKDRLSKLLEAAYQRLKTDELVTRMGYYERNQPGENIQELHSILPTEFKDLGSELESYYSKYFSNRQSVVEIHAKYSAIIADIESKRNALKTEIDALEAKINSDVSSYNNDVNQINTEVAALEKERATIDTTNYAAVIAFNSKRASLLSRIQALAPRKASIQAMQDSYNSKIEQYNALVLTGNQLSSSMNSSLEETYQVGS